jgi:hypothetical protein
VEAQTDLKKRHPADRLCRSQEETPGGSRTGCRDMKIALIDG